MYGIVLAGGGARGAYEIGALKALNELGIKIGGVCGTSIGSINAAMYAQGDFDACEQIWRRISTKDVVDMSVFSDEKLISVKNIGAFFDEMRNNSGISLSPLEDMLKAVISEEKLLLSPIDFGLVTYSLSDNQIIELFKSDIPKGMLVEYLMASSALPGVKARVIGEKTYIDGGMGDNKPVNMLINKGYRDIISIDVGGVGFVRPHTKKGVNIIEIKCSSPIIGVMEFDSKLIADTIDMGYIDAKRALGRLTGRIYSFRVNDYVRARYKYSEDLIEGLEDAAKIYDINTLKEYTVEALSKKVVAAFEHYRLLVEKVGDGKLTTPKLVFTKNCLDILVGRDTASKVPKKYDKAVNSACYFIRNS